MTNSSSLYDRATRAIPGGVNSPVRSFSGVGGEPFFVASASGSHIKDTESREYIDFVMSWGPLIFGHAYPPLVEAATRAVELGSTYGAPTEGEVLLAEKICELVPNVEQFRAVSSGTEATMTAIRLARGFTGKNKLIKFAGHYHGHSDSLLVAAGSGVATLGLPNSPGVTEGAAHDTVVVEWNNEEDLREAVEACGDDLAAIIYEPVACNMGCVKAKEGFHDLIRELCAKAGGVLIVDEVMTGFRLGLAGAIGRFSLDADIVTFGKVIGGGYPLAGLGGKREIMQYLAPAGDVYQAGTLSGNPVAVASGLAQLELLSDDLYSHLETLAKRLCDGLTGVFSEAAIPAIMPREGSMFALYFSEQPINNFADAAKANHERYAKFFHLMLEEGIYLPPSGYEAWFVSFSHSMEDIDKTIQAAKAVVSKL